MKASTLKRISLKIMATILTLMLCVGVFIVPTFAQEVVEYLEYDATLNDGAGGFKTSYATDYTLYSSGSTLDALLTSGVYVIEGSVKVNDGHSLIEGDVHIILKDGAKLSGEGFAVNAGNSLSFYAQSQSKDTMGRMEIYCGHTNQTAAIGALGGYDGGDITIHGGNMSVDRLDNGTAYGAAIGGAVGKNAGAIKIHGGYVSGYGSTQAAFIGGGAGGHATSIEITGGEIVAQAGCGQTSNGAAIGGGNGGHGGSIIISGGVITAYDRLGNNVPGIGGTDGETYNSVTIKNSAVVYTSKGLYDYTNVEDAIIFTVQEKSNANAVGTVYGNVTLTTDLEITSGQSLTIPAGAKLEIAQGVTLTNNGTLVNNGAFINNGGTYINNGRKVTPITYREYKNGEFITVTANSYNILTSAPAGNELTEGIWVVNSNITTSSLITIVGNVKIILCDGYTWNASKGIKVENNNTISFYDEYDASAPDKMGSLIVRGLNPATDGETQAAIGGAGATRNGVITIHGGFFDLIGGYDHPAIGGVTSSNTNNLVSNSINIHGGVIYAKGGNNAAGIGSGSWGKCGDITITGGEVYATAGESTGSGKVAGIGTGSTDKRDYMVGAISISGGKVVATGGANGYGMGSGGIDGANNATVRISNNALVYSNTVLPDSATIDNSIVFEGKDGAVYGDATLYYDTAVESDETLSIPLGNTLTIADGVKLVNRGQVSSSGQIIQNGVVDNSMINSGYKYLEYADGNWLTGSKAKNEVTLITSTTSGTLAAGWYVLDGSFTNTNRLTVSGNVHIIIADNANVILSKGITVEGDGNTLNIYAQSTGDNMGSLTAQSSGGAGIGSATNASKVEHITIHGGAISATGTTNAAGIGGSQSSTANVTIHGGNITANAGSGGVGIGAGGHIAATKGDCGSVTITGGYVNATGNGNEGSNSAAIGMAHVLGTSNTYTVNISGGTVIAKVGGTVTTNNIAIGNVVGNTTVSITGGAVVNQTGTMKNVSAANALVIDGSTATLYGNAVITENVSIPAGVTLEVGAQQTITVKNGATLTNMGTINLKGQIIEDGGYFENQGTVTGRTAYIEHNGTDFDTLYKTDSEATLIASQTSLTEGWYIVNTNKSLASLSISGEVHIIVANNKTLAVTGNVTLGEGASLIVHSQTESANRGKLTVGGSISGGIVFEIHGAEVTAAGIGAASAYGAVIYVGSEIASLTNINSIIFVNKSAIVSQNVTLNGNLTLTSGQTLTVNAGGVLTVSDGVTLTVKSGATLTELGDIVTVGTGKVVVEDGAVFTEKITYYEYKEGLGEIKPDDITDYKILTDTNSLFDSNGNIGKDTTNKEVVTWYVVEGYTEISRRFGAQGKVHIILRDGATLYAKQGIGIPENCELHIHVESYGENMGKLVATSTNTKAAIGGTSGGMGHFMVHGGDITATATGTNAAAIGSCGTGGMVQSINIYGGEVNATAGFYGAAIGSGSSGRVEKIEITGGKVTAQGGQASAGIGSGKSGTAGTITIKNAEVYATGGASDGNSAGAGIGGGHDGKTDEIYIENSYVEATGGGAYASGIGSGRYDIAVKITIKNSEVHATGGSTTSGDMASAIGGGLGDNKTAMTIEIDNSYVEAKVLGTGCGIGDGGTGGDAGMLTLTVKNNSILITDGIDAQTTVTPHENSVVMDSKANIGKVYGNVTLGFDYTIENSQNLTLSKDNTLTVGAGKTFTNKGTFTKLGTVVANNDAESGKYANAGTEDLGILYLTYEGGVKVENYVEAPIKLTTTAISGYTTVSGSQIAIVKDGWYIIEGTALKGSRQIFISDGVKAHIILADGSNTTLTSQNGWIKVGVGAELDIYAQSEDVATMGAYTSSSYSGGNYAGIGLLEGAKLTIHGGKITATGYTSAGIGGVGATSAAGATITINGGNITATGGLNSAGIGGAAQVGAMGAITINGGTINSTGGTYAAGIGTGAGNGKAIDTNTSSTESITINGGTIIAQGGAYGAAGIGSGHSGVTGKITVANGNITSTGGGSGAGIGSGYRASTGDIIIQNGHITANGGTTSGAGIGSGLQGTTGAISISGGTVIAVGGNESAAIGGGEYESGDNATGGAPYAGGTQIPSITISGGNITAKGNASSSQQGAGIGTGKHGSVGTITISGGTVNAYGGNWASAIGGGSCGVVNNINISGGNVYAENNTQSEYAAVIGNGHAKQDVAVNVSIMGGNIRAVSKNTHSNAGTVIGSNSGMISIGGDASLIMSRTSDSNAWYNVTPVINEETGAIIFEGTDGVMYGDVTLGEGMYTVPKGATLEIPENQTLTLSDGTTFINNGTLKLVGDIVEEEGSTFTNNGNFLDKISYIKYSYNETDGLVREEIKDFYNYKVYDGQTTLTDGYWYFDKDVTIPSRLTITGDVHIILGKNVKVNATNGITVNANNSLSIYVTDDTYPGILKATASSGAGIGGSNSASGTITIHGGKIEATGAASSSGIGGSGESKATGDITIYGGEIEARGGSGAAGIGGAVGATSVNIEIHGGKVTAYGGIGTEVNGINNAGAGIGTGNSGSSNNAEGYILITNGTIFASSYSTNTRGAGIGSGHMGTKMNIEILGGNITATGGQSSAGVGAGSGSPTGNITIKNATVKSTGGDKACGIGGGESGACGNIVIENAVIEAIKTTSAAGYSAIGGVNSGKTITINGSQVQTTGDIATYTGTNNIMIADGTGTVSGTATLKKDITVAADKTFTVPDGATLTVPNGMKITNNGIVYNKATLNANKDGYGTVTGEIYGPVDYIGYDGTKTEYKDQHPTLQQSDYIIVNKDNIPATWGVADTDTWYYIEGELEISSRITINGNVKFILADGSKATFTRGILVGDPNTFAVYAQSTGANKGKLYATTTQDNAAIGSYTGKAGAMEFHGGYIHATGGSWGAGIGSGGGTSSVKSILITGGEIHARTTTPNNTHYVAAIGGGSNATVESLKIYGGLVYAYNESGYVSTGIGLDNTSNGTMGTFEIKNAMVVTSAFNRVTPQYDDCLVMVDGSANAYGEFTLPESITIASGKTFTIDENATFTVPEGMTVTNNGAVYAKGVLNANKDGYGSVTGEIVGSIEFEIGSYDAESNKTTYTPTRVSNYTIYDGRKTIGEAGKTTYWYFDRNITVTTRVEVLGDVHIILGKGVKVDMQAGIAVGATDDETMNSLSIYTLDKSNPGTLIANAAGAGGKTAGIGGGSGVGHTGKISIHGGIIQATGYGEGAGIGAACSYSAYGAITIYDGDVTSTGGNWAAGIGGDDSSVIYLIAIHGGTVKAYGGKGGAGIGSGNAWTNTKQQLREILITGGNITAVGGEYITADNGQTSTINNYGGGAGIGTGGDEVSFSGTITILGGTINATGGGWAAGIGAGQYGGITADGKIIIKNATVTSSAGSNTGGEYVGWGAGIGAADNQNMAGTIIIENSNITATGTKGGAGIGGGHNGTVTGSITITDSYVAASSLKSGGYTTGQAIGSGHGKTTTGTITINGSQIVAQNPVEEHGGTNNIIFVDNTGSVSGEATLRVDHTISGLSTLTIDEGETVKIADGVTLTNNGIITKNGEIVEIGTFINNGTLLGKVLYTSWTGTGYKYDNEFVAAAGNVWNTKAPPSTSTLGSAIYMVQGHVSYNGDLTVTGDTGILLSDYSTFDITGKIIINNGATLTIYVQSTDVGMGTLNVDGIVTNGNLVIVGGNITSEGGNDIAGIGAGTEAATGNIKICGGNLNLSGGGSAGGLGKGGAAYSGKISIVGGNIYAAGGIVTTGSFSAGLDNGKAIGCAIITSTSLLECANAEYGNAFVTVGDNRYVYGEVETTGDMAIGTDAAVTVNEGATWIIADGHTVKNYGNITNNGLILIHGKLENTSVGVIDNAQTGVIETNGNGTLGGKGVILGEGTFANEGVSVIHKDQYEELDEAEKEGYIQFIDENSNIWYVKGATVIDKDNIPAGNILGAEGRVTWYVVKGEVTLKETGYKAQGQVRVLLMNDAVLTVENGITVTRGSTFATYVQLVGTEGSQGIIKNETVTIVKDNTAEFYLSIPLESVAVSDEGTQISISLADGAIFPETITGADVIKVGIQANYVLASQNSAYTIPYTIKVGDTTYDGTYSDKTIVLAEFTMDGENTASITVKPVIDNANGYTVAGSYSSVLTFCYGAGSNSIWADANVVDSLAE